MESNLTDWSGKTISSHEQFMSELEKTLIQSQHDLLEVILEKLKSILSRHTRWSPDCGYDSEEEKGFQKGLIAEAKLIESEILSILTIKEETPKNYEQDYSHYHCFEDDMRGDSEDHKNHLACCICRKPVSTNKYRI